MSPIMNKRNQPTRGNSSEKRGKPPRRFTLDDAMDMKKLRSQGMYLHEIAEIYNTSKVTVKTYIDNIGTSYFGTENA